MNAYLFLKSLLTTTAFLPRHFFFIATAIVFSCLAWTVIYGLMLGIAIFTHGQLGNLLSYPIGILGLMIAGLLFGSGLGLPCCAAGYWACRRFQWRKSAAIPVVFCAGASISTPVIYGFIGSLQGVQITGGLIWAFITYAWAIAPLLGIYWWLTESPNAIFDGFRRWALRRYFEPKPSE